LFNSASNEVIKKLPTFSPQEISNTVWSYAAFSHSSPALFHAASEEAIKKVSSFNSQEISRLLLSYARNNHDAPELFCDAIHEVTRNLHECDARDTLDILWSLAVMNSMKPDLAEPFLQHTAKLLADERNLTIVNLAKLHQALVWYSLEHERKSEECKHLYDKCFSAFTSLPNKLSKFQQGVVSTLLWLGMGLKQEVFCERTGYSIDAIIVTKEGREVAVEVDGPHHFIDGRIPTGSTALKHRHLKLGERAFLAIPYWDWYELNQDPKGQQEYLEKAIARVLSNVNGRSD